jgi:hypothetical protein
LTGGNKICFYYNKSIREIVNYYSHFRKHDTAFFKKIKGEIYDPALPLLDAYPKDVNSECGSAVGLPSKVHCGIAHNSQIRNRPKCHPTDAWILKCGT